MIIQAYITKNPRPSLAKIDLSHVLSVGRSSASSSSTKVDLSNTASGPDKVTDALPPDLQSKIDFTTDPIDIVVKSRPSAFDTREDAPKLFEKAGEIIEDVLKSSPECPPGFIRDAIGNCSAAPLPTAPSNQQPLPPSDQSSRDESNERRSWALWAIAGGIAATFVVSAFTLLRRR